MKEEYQYNCVTTLFLLDLFRLTKFQNDEGQILVMYIYALR